MTLEALREGKLAAISVAKLSRATGEDFALSLLKKGLRVLKKKVATQVVKHQGGGVRFQENSARLRCASPGFTSQQSFEYPTANIQFPITKYKKHIPDLDIGHSLLDIGYSNNLSPHPSQ